MNKKLTIITINYNNFRGLKRTVESVMTINFDYCEYIIIDGGSNDGSAEFIASIGDKIDHWVSETDKGIYHAMNKGIRAAKGNYILFLNSGDMLIEDKKTLDMIFCALNEKAVYYAPVFLDQGTLTVKKIDYPRELDEKFVFTDTLCQQAVIYHSSLFHNNFFDEKLKYVSDWKMHFSLFKVKFKFLYLDVPFAIYDSNGLTSNGLTKYTAHKERLKAQFQDYPNYFLKYYGTNYRMYLRLLKMYLKIS